MNFNNIMTYFLILMYLLITNIHCHCSSSNKQQIQFYFRRIGGTNGYETYMDEFKITNYRNKTILPKDLYEFAQHYVDTVHADKPVSSVDFVGEKPCEDLPEDPVEDPFNIEQKRFLIGFGFDNFMGKNAVKTNIELHDISISRAGKTKIYYLHFADDKHIADSILSSKELFDSDF